MKKLREITLNEIKRNPFNSFYHSKGPNSVPKKAHSAEELSQERPDTNDTPDPFADMFKNTNYSVFHKPTPDSPWQHHDDFDNSIKAARTSQALKDKGNFDSVYGSTKNTDDHKENPIDHVKRILGNKFKA